MNLDITWNPNRKFKKDAHALFGASKYHWINYDENKMLEVYNSNKAKKVGTELHEMAALLIKNKTMLPDVKKTLNQYVNDSILYDLRPEQQLYYSDYFFGTADAIGIIDGVLRIHDLKTGKTPTSMNQLIIYASFFFLEYGLLPTDFKDIELRIYQNNEIKIENPTTEDIVPVMDKIVTVDNIIRKENQRNGYDHYL